MLSHDPWGPLLTAGICDQHLGAVLRLLPTTGVCDQCLGTVPRLLPIAGVCNQNLDPVLDLFLLACVCHQLLGISLQVYQAYIRFPATATLTAGNQSWPCPFWAEGQV